MILAGGLGTRLGPLLGERNKPMMPIAGRPFMAYLLDYLRRFGVDEIVVCIGHRGELIRSHFGDGARWGVRLQYATEHELLGTAGALKLAEPLLRGDRFFVLNGDSFCNVDLRALGRFHDDRHARVSLALVTVQAPERYGTVRLDDAGAIQRFVEKGPGTTGSAALINAGVYLLRREVLASVPANQVSSLERDIFPVLVDHGLYGLPLDAYFVDIGIPETYLQLAAEPSPLLQALAGEAGMSREPGE